MSEKRRATQSVGTSRVTSTTSSPDRRNASRNKKQFFDAIRLCQQNGIFHSKAIDEMQRISIAVANHQIFGSWLLEALREWLKCPLDNQYADTGLDCLVKFLIMMNGSNNQPNTKSHTLFVGCFTFLCITTSQVVDVRVRIYKVIAALLTKLNGAGHLIDIQLIDDLQAKVFDQLCNESEGEVRAQMLSALRWLQHPFDPQCTVTDRYRHHMTHDPAVCVRMVTLASIRRAPHIIPCIVDRLYDIETRVRKYCVLQLCGMPLERMVIEQRWRIVTTLLQEQSDVVKNAAVKYLFPNWLDHCGNDYVRLIDQFYVADDQQKMPEFGVMAKNLLKMLFTSNKIDIDALIAQTPIEKLADDHGSEGAVIPINRIRLSNAIYWLVLIEHAKEHHADRLVDIRCDVSFFCDYLRSFIDYSEEYHRSDYDQVICVLLDISDTFDVEVEFIRVQYFDLVEHMLRRRLGCELIHEKIMRLWEKLEIDQDVRLDRIADLVRQQNININGLVFVNHPEIFDLIHSLLDPHTKTMMVDRRLALIALHEDYITHCDEANFFQAEETYEHLLQANAEYVAMLKALVMNEPELQCIDPAVIAMVNGLTAKDTTNHAQVIQSLQQCFHVVCSKATLRLNEKMAALYKDFISHKTGSTKVHVRYWAIKCSIAFALAYKQMAIEVCEMLGKQLMEHRHLNIWAVVIQGICELFAVYRITYFDMSGLSTAEMEDQQWPQINVDDPPGAADVANSAKMNHLLRIFDIITDPMVRMSLVKGWSLLVLSGQYSTMMMSKLLLLYFSTEGEHNDQALIDIYQHLRAFLDKLVQRRQRESLQLALINTVNMVVNSPLERYNFDPEYVANTIIKLTQPNNADDDDNLHHLIAASILNVITQHGDEVELCRVLAAALTDLKIGRVQRLCDNFKRMLRPLMQGINRVIDENTIQSLVMFEGQLNGVEPSRHIRQSVSMAAVAAEAGGNGEAADDDNEIDDDVTVQQIITMSQEADDNWLSQRLEHSMAMPSEADSSTRRCLS